MKKIIFILTALLTCFYGYSQTAEEYFDRGVDHARQGEYRAVIADYNKAIELKPDLAEAYYNRGLAKLHLGRLDGGCLDLSKAGELGYLDAYDLIREHCN